MIIHKPSYWQPYQWYVNLTLYVAVDPSIKKRKFSTPLWVGVIKNENSNFANFVLYVNKEKPKLHIHQIDNNQYQKRVITFLSYHGQGKNILQDRNWNIWIKMSCPFWTLKCLTCMILPFTPKPSFHLHIEKCDTHSVKD